MVQPINIKLLTRSIVDLFSHIIGERSENKRVGEREKKKRKKRKEKRRKRGNKKCFESKMQQSYM
jgi:hypothetical protein